MLMLMLMALLLCAAFFVLFALWRVVLEAVFLNFFGHVFVGELLVVFQVLVYVFVQVGVKIVLIVIVVVFVFEQFFGVFTA